jgi:hypothetical protein
MDSFWEIFSDAANKREDLSGASKFSYLIGQLQGEAFYLLQGFQHTNDDYDEAINLLKETYGKPQRIIQAHLYHIFDIPSPGESAKELSQFRAEYESQFRALKVLAIDVDAASHVYTALLTRKLPLRIRDNLNRATKSNYLNLDELQQAIKEEIERLEITDNFQAVSNINNNAGSKANQPF